MQQHASRPPDEAAALIYDGECPVCSAYTRYVRLKESVGRLDLVDARKPDPRVDAVRARGLDLDEGMVLIYGGRFYHGADCIHMLALLSTRSGPFNRLNAALFARPRLARLLYPALRTGRNGLLALLRKPRLD